MSNKTKKKFFERPLVIIITAVLACVIVCGILGGLTTGFTDFEEKSVEKNYSTLLLNKNNLFYDTIEEGTLYDGVNYSAKVKNGIITLNGESVDTDSDSVTISDTITFATVRLEEGTYTLSAFANADWKNCYVVGTYTVDGITHTWYSDYDKVPASLVTDTVHARTLELESETAVTFAVKVCEGAELKNTKITPVLVEGEDVGNYYVGILGFLG